jgi:hypothetical protein
MGRELLVFVTPKRFPSAYYSNDGIVARIDLSQPEADEQLAEARIKAASYARQIDELERSRV